MEQVPGENFHGYPSSHCQRTNQQTSFLSFVTKEFPQIDTENKNLSEEQRNTSAEKQSISTESRVHTSARLSKTLASDKALKDPLLKIPLLEYGWKREVVIRGSTDKYRGIRPCDVYYYTPEGKKVRSKTEILDHLPPDGPLEPCHFSFSKGVVGVDNESIEWVREAGVSKNSPKYVKEMRPSAKGTIHNKLQSRKRKLSPPKKIISKEKKVSLNLPHKPEEIIKEESPEAYDPDNLVVFNGTFLTQNTEKVKTTPLVCSILCPAAMGCIPSLQCTKCLCLYHNQCLGFPADKEFYSYVCTNCRLIPLTNNRAEIIPVKKAHQTESPPQKRLKLQPSTCLISTSSSLLRPTPSTTISKILPKPSSQQPAKNVVQKYFTTTAVKVPAYNSKSSFRSIVPKSKEALGLSSKENNPVPQSIIHAGNNRFVAVSKKKIPPVLPRPSPQTGKLPTGNQLRVPSNVTSKSPLTGTYIMTNASKGSMLLPVSPSLAATPSYYIMKNGQMQAVLGTPPVNPKTSTTTDKVPSRVKIPALRISSKSESYTGLVNTAGNIFDALIRVFTYLPLTDLLRVAEVNKMFNAAARQRSLWQSVRLQNTKVLDWISCANFLNKMDTESLSLKGMYIPENFEDSKILWRNLHNSIKDIHSLKRLDLGVTAGPEIAIVKQCPQLTHVSCTFKLKFTLDFITTMSSLSKITHLHVRGHELKRETSLKLVGTSALVTMRSLTHLSLTSVKNMSDTNWANFVIDMPQLEHLELGECTTFNKEFATNALSYLRGLKRLRLEMVPELITNEILDTISSFPDLHTLELINCDVKTGFVKALSSCLNISNLHIIPTYNRQSSVTVETMILSLVQLEHSLKKVVWGFTTELIKVTEMLIAQYSLPEYEDSTNEYIPIIPSSFPIPLESQNRNSKAPSDGKKYFQVDILPLSKLEEMLKKKMPLVDISLSKIPHAHTLQEFI